MRGEQFKGENVDNRVATAANNLRKNTLPRTSQNGKERKDRARGARGPTYTRNEENKPSIRILKKQNRKSVYVDMQKRNPISTGVLCKSSFLEHRRVVGGNHNTAQHKNIKVNEHPKQQMQAYVPSKKKTWRFWNQGKKKREEDRRETPKRKNHHI